MSRSYARDERGRFASTGGVTKRAKSSINGLSASSMSARQKIQAAEIMFGAGSKQHTNAKRKFK